MANKQILDYIEANIAAHTKESLTRVLIEGGWPAADVAAAFLEFERPKQVGPDAIVVEAVGPTAFQSAPVTAAPMDAGAAMLAEMEKHRKEADALNPNITVGHSAPVYIPEQQTSDAKGIIGMLIKTGLVKNEAQANMVMIVFVVLVFAALGWFLWTSL